MAKSLGAVAKKSIEEIHPRETGPYAADATIFLTKAGAMAAAATHVPRRRRQHDGVRMPGTPNLGCGVAVFSVHRSDCFLMPAPSTMI